MKTIINNDSLSIHKVDSKVLKFIEYCAVISIGELSGITEESLRKEFENASPAKRLELISEWAVIMNDAQTKLMNEGHALLVALFELQRPNNPKVGDEIVKNLMEGIPSEFHDSK